MRGFFKKMIRVIKDRLIVINDFIKGKTNIALRNYSIAVIVFFSLISCDFVTNYIFEFSPKIGSLYLGVLFYTFLILSAAIIAVFLKFLVEKMNESYHKNEEKYKRKLFDWLGEEAVSERFIYKLFQSNADENYNDIDNLIKVKQKLFEELKGDIVNYRLLKNHFEHKQQNNSMKKLNLVMLALLGTLSTALISPLIQKLINVGQYIDKMDFKFLFNDFSEMGYYTIFIFLGAAFSVYYIFLSTYSHLTERSRRNEYLISILDVLIEEKKTIK